MIQPFQPLKSPPTLAREFGVTVRQVEHAITSYRIDPLTRISGIRLYDAAGAERIRSALVRTGALTPPRKAGAR